MPDGKRLGPTDGVVWITGASTGIGKALSLELASRGWTVAATARRAEGLEALADGGCALAGRIIPFAGDVTDTSSMAGIAGQIEAEAGPIVWAVLNAGIYLPVEARPFDLAAFNSSFAVNLNGTVNCLAPVVDRMVERGGGRIAIMASVAGYRGLPTSAAYGATKAGLINLAESLKFDLDPLGVSVAVINPGFVKTPATDKNSFPMPFLMDVGAAASRIADGLATDRFEITFPQRFTYLLKLLRLLPYRYYFPFIARRTRGTG